MKIPGAVGAACLHRAIPLLLLTGRLKVAALFAFLSADNLLVALPLLWDTSTCFVERGNAFALWECTSFIE
jgi:hypothetical protein